MNGHAMSQSSASYEENVHLLDEKTLSDIESDSGRVDNETRFPAAWRWVQSARTALSAIPRQPPSMAATRHFVLRAAFFLLPSFVQSRISHGSWSRGPERLGPTAYLDGMRGLAAFFVFFCHYFYTCFVIADGWGSDDENYDILKLPILRLFYAGPPMVAVFFIVSGYALSLKPLRQARQQKWDGFSVTMASFIFRRWFRLFMPTAISTLMIVVLLRLGVYEWNRDFSLDSTYYKNVQEVAPDLKDTLSEQLTDWGWNMFDFVHIWGWEQFGGSTYYDVHLWTIPVEFRASMMLFLTLIGLARLRTALRFFFLGAVVWFSYRSDRWEMVLFYAGMLYAELDLIRGAHSDPATTAALQGQTPQGLPTTEPKALDYVGTGQHEPGEAKVRRWRKLKRFGWAMLSVLALYFLSQPDVNSENTPGWVFLSSLIPEWVGDKYRYYQCLGAILFVFCVTRMPSWQRVFNSGVVQYLGKISYAIYLMHGPVLHTVGYSFEKWAWEVTGVDDFNYNLGFMLAAIFVVPSVIWAADVFWRAVDAPVVRFAKWLEGKCIVQEEAQPQGRS